MAAVCHAPLTGCLDWSLVSFICWCMIASRGLHASLRSKQHAPTICPCQRGFAVNQGRLTCFSSKVAQVPSTRLSRLFTVDCTLAPVAEATRLRSSTVTCTCLSSGGSAVLLCPSLTHVDTAMTGRQPTCPGQACPDHARDAGSGKAGACGACNQGFSPAWFVQVQTSHKR